MIFTIVVMKEHNVINQKAVDRLKDYYPYDEDSRTFTITFHFKSVSDVLVEEHLDSKMPLVSPKIIEEISEKLHSIPDGYHANVEIIIDDYQGHDEELIVHAIKDAAYDRQYVGSQQYKNIAIRAGIVALAGIFWIVLAYAGDYFKWWGDPTSITSNVLSGILNVFAVVFVWEAVNTIIIHQNPFIKEFRYFIKRMKYLIIRGKDGKENKMLLTSVGPFSHYRLRASSEWLLMFGSIFFFIIIMLRLIRYFNAVFTTYYDVRTYELIITPVLLSLFFILSISAVLIYKGYLKLLFPSLILNYVAFFIAVADLMLVFIGHAPRENIVSAIIVMVSSVLLTIGLSIRYYVYKKVDQ